MHTFISLISFNTSVYGLFPIFHYLQFYFFQQVSFTGEESGLIFSLFYFCGNAEKSWSQFCIEATSPCTSGSCL